ncbi:hypothetical protein [Flavobacterium terrisoli]|uniref:hypothetical protein n=1 Tax=Flavobacterium terrisoli TaxID=3242195 RepID=UPI002542A395|nr:hypothetical protein [Flavobacterium buctense]
MENKKETAQEKYNVFLNNLLKKKLFESAMDIHNALMKAFNVTPENARKIVARAVDQKVIKSSKPYTFGKGQYVYIYNEHYFDKEGIKTVTQKSRPPIYRLLELMDQNGGITSYYEALKITAAPLEESSTKVTSLEDILTLLMKLDIIYKKKDRNDVVFIIYKEDKKEVNEVREGMMMAFHFNKMVMDCTVLPDILRWLGNSNIIDNNGVIYRNKKTPQIGAVHNNLVWDAFAYTKATGINHIMGARATTSDKQTLVALDVVLAEEYSAIHLDAFLSRIQINLNSVKEGDRKILPIIVYKSCSDHTFNKIKMNGILAFDVASIFGTRIYEVLDRMAELSILLFRNDQIDNTIEGILKTISSAGQDEALKELRGTLFEFLMYPLLTILYPNANIKRGKILERINEVGEKEKYEYDYIIESSNPPELIFVELKGYQAGATIKTGDSNTKASLKWFFKKTLPFAENFYKARLSELPVKAVFITSANFYDDGLEFLTKMDNSKYKAKNLNTGYNRTSLLALLKENGFENEIRILNKFYSRSDDRDELSDAGQTGNILQDLELDYPKV